MDAAPIVSRCVNQATGALGTLQSGKIGMLRREEYLTQYEALADQDSWRGTVPKLTGPGWSRTQTMPSAWPSIPSAAWRSSIGANGAPSQATSGPRGSEGQLIS